MTPGSPGCIHAASLEFKTFFTEGTSMSDKRKAQKFLQLLAVAWQREVRENGSGPMAEHHRAQLTGALALYREVFDVYDVTQAYLVDTYCRAAQDALDTPNPAATKEA